MRRLFYLVCVYSLLLLPAFAQESISDLTAGEVQKLAGGNQFIEGPVWHRDGFLLFSDIPAEQIKKWDGASLSVWDNDSGASNGLTIDEQGRVIACEHGGRRISAHEADGSVVAIADAYQGDAFNSPNDAVVRSDGTIFFTDPDWGLSGRPREISFNGVYRVKPGGEAVLLDNDYSKPNGIALSPDETKLYVADDTRNFIRVYDLDAEGNVSNASRFASVSNPDGIKVDVDGRVWSSSSAGVMVYSTSGERIGVVAFPEQPANLAFGGADFKTLFVTARTGLYSIELTVAGLDPWRIVPSGIRSRSLE
ncbi:MAG: SMP-30/gluconolactonase/LRE family protein [Candidatus Hinthialibacter antarcticus]|nr:SMP-30/gluconolactonase/LRE family protein [Candidatus Hinthialibacter antarcticus]